MFGREQLVNSAGMERTKLSQRGIGTARLFRPSEKQTEMSSSSFPASKPSAETSACAADATSGFCRFQRCTAVQLAAGPTDIVSTSPPLCCMFASGLTTAPLHFPETSTNILSSITILILPSYYYFATPPSWSEQRLLLVVRGWLLTPTTTNEVKRRPIQAAAAPPPPLGLSSRDL